MLYVQSIDTSTNPQTNIYGEKKIGIVRGIQKQPAWSETGPEKSDECCEPD